MVTLRLYETAEGKCPFDEWFNVLDAKAAVKVTAALTRMELGNFGDVKPVGQGVSERRIDFGPGYRIYFGRVGDEIVILLCGGSKKRQQKDIEAAKACWNEYKRRKKGG
ncbi:MAG: type II toxin-antitoxin system RelE/ParE family toxin [Pseudomonadota bacterium]